MPLHGTLKACWETDFLKSVAEKYLQLVARDSVTPLIPRMVIRLQIVILVSSKTSALQKLCNPIKTKDS